MANPQREDGHVDIANEIVEVLAKTYLSSYESQVLWAIFRKTYGWHKKEDWLTNTQIMGMTGIAESHVSRTIKKLLGRNVVIKNGKKLSFQKDYEKWEKIPKQASKKNLPKQVKKITQIGKKNLPKQVNTKEKKETITKEIILSQIKNMLTLFSETSEEKIQVYWDNAAKDNKTGVITEGRKLTLLTELYNLMKRTSNISLFNYALESSNRYGVANIGYVGAIIKNKITEVNG